MNKGILVKVLPTSMMARDWKGVIGVFLFHHDTSSIIRCVGIKRNENTIYHYTLNVETRCLEIVSS